MKRKFLCSAAVILLLSTIIVGAGAAPLPMEKPSAARNIPIVVIIADKLNSLELYQSGRPAVQRLVNSGSCGLMNIRSGARFNHTGSGYLSLGSGGRNAVTSDSIGACYPEEPLPGGAARLYLHWSFERVALHPANLIVPDIGMLLEDAKDNEFNSIPGLLGEVFQRHGWSTCLIGNLDAGNMPETPFRPGGYLLMNRRGIIDEGELRAVNEKSRFFPYQLRFNVSQTLHELERRLDRKKIIAVEFGDFYRLDAYQLQILPERFQALKAMAWDNFNRFLDRIFQLQENKPFALVLISPSVSQESRSQGNLLAPVVIRDAKYPPGILTSGTTKWPGLVANNDFLPTLAHIGGITARIQTSGRVMISQPAETQPQQLLRLNQRLTRFYLIQRPLLNWYMGIISVGWIGGLLCVLWRKKPLANYLITTVMAIPLLLILFPLFPTELWGMLPFFLLAPLLGFLFFRIKGVKTRVLILTAAIWGILVADQISGWNLIRYSALGYSAVDGSRYYGMGNEFMGIFLAASLILAHAVHERTARTWPVWAILGVAIAILSLPQFGAKFGGILSGAIGITFYLIHLHRVNLKNKKLWMAVGGFCLILAAVGWWDSIRPPEIQTHIGRFVRLFWTRDFSEISAIIFRKLNMNYKLTIASPWMRITLLAVVIGLCYRLCAKKNLLQRANDRLIWRSLLTIGIASYLVNDAGVLALATCLAYGFSYILLQLTLIDPPDVVHR